jgi:hypothetical protein
LNKLVVKIVINTIYRRRFASEFGGFEKLDHGPDKNRPDPQQWSKLFALWQNKRLLVLLLLLVMYFNYLIGTV